ncbi:MAG TPA: HD domain-containing phosphohydrolase [Albitalea sp.]|nr:HD domain-containing phosphohydrolase [Albitalea sp.]
MKSAASTIQIDVDSLRVGMFIHLDVGWMSHPFPLSSFRLSSAEQIGIIRSLGIKQLRWSPEQSALMEAQDEAARAIEAAAQSSGAAAGAARGDAAANAEEPPELAARRQRRAAVAAQRSALALCERQFAEATRECKVLTDQAVAEPHAARDKAQALTQAFVDKMLGAHDVCIRLLTEAAGDRASSHAVNVTLISLLMGRCFGLAQPEMLDLGVGALLHDIGKADLPPRVRHREEHFTASEAKFYEEHVGHGVAHALKMGLSPGATMVIAQHHEHADGSGFPLKLGTERMSPMSRIVALVNRYDNLCNPHLPARALTPHESLSLLFAQGKTKYDTAILGAFIKMMGVYPLGSVVQLTDDRFAIVVGVNSSRPLKPRVVVHDPKVPPDEAAILDLETTPNLGIRRSVRPQTLPADALAALAPRPRIAYFFEPASQEPEG